MGIESKAIDPSNPLIPWESDISIGAIAFVSSIVVSQFGRAIIAKIYSIKIQSLGLTTILGIIPTNPFIELNKDDISKLPLKRKNTLFSVDPLSNILLSLLSFGFLYILVSSLSPISNDFGDKAGITVLTIGENSLAKSIGLEKNSTITFINNEPIEDGDELRNILRDNLGTTIQIKWMREDNKEQIQSVNLPTSVPENKGVLGITFTDTYFDPVLVLDNYNNLFLTNQLAILMPPTLQKNLVPYSDVMSSQYTSSIFGSSFPIIANLLFWIWFINFNFGVFKSLPISYLPGGSLYNSIIEYKLKNKPKWIVKGITISVSIIMILYAFILTNNYLAY